MHVLLTCVFAGLVTLYILHICAVGWRGTTEDLSHILDGQCEVGRLTSFIFYFPAFLIRIFKYVISALIQ